MQALCNLSKSLLAALDPANTTTTWRISGMSCLKKGILTPKGITGTPSCVGQGTIWFIIYYILKLYLQESVRARTFTTICWSTFFYSRHHCMFELLILNETACFKCSFGMKTKFIYTCPGQKNVTATSFGQLHACFNQWRFAKHKARIQQQKPHCCKTVPTIYNPIRTCGRSSCFDKTKNTVPVCKFDCPRAPRPKLFFHVRHQQADALGARICSTMRQRCQPAKFWGMFPWLTQTWQFLSWHFGWWPNTWPLVHHRLQTSMQHKTMQFFSRTSAAGAAGKPETAKEISPWHPHHENKWPKNKLHTYVAKYVPTRAFYPSPQMIFFFLRDKRNYTAHRPCRLSNEGGETWHRQRHQERCHHGVKLAQSFGAPCGLRRPVSAPVTRRVTEEQSWGGQVNTAKGPMLVDLVTWSAWSTCTADCCHPWHVVPCKARDGAAANTTTTTPNKSATTTASASTTGQQRWGWHAETATAGGGIPALALARAWLQGARRTNAACLLMRRRRRKQNAPKKADGLAKCWNVSHDALTIGSRQQTAKTSMKNGWAQSTVAAQARQNAHWSSQSPRAKEI